MAVDPYAHGHHGSVLRSHTWRTVSNSAAHLLPHLSAGDSLLDIGSGPGTITADFAKMLAPGNVIGIDASADVVAKATADHEPLGLENLSFEVGDAYELSFADDTFDVVHTHQVLHHVSDPVAMLREMGRVTKPGGIVSAREVDYEGTIWAPDHEGLTDWLALYLQVHRGTSGEPSAGRHLKAWARSAGFTDVTHSASVWLFESDDDRAWWGGMWAERAVASAFADNARRLGLADTQRLEKISQAWRDWAEDPDGWLLMPHAEMLARV